MRYQQYKNRMLRVRKILDFFYRLRFVFLGIVVAVVATTITLDVTKGNITESTKFAISYKYGEEIQVSGAAFMGNVTYEFRQKVGNDYTDWTEEKPVYAGSYEARAKSMGNHGYKYSAISAFNIDPIDTELTISESLIEYGNDSPNISCNLLGNDHLVKGHKVIYGDLSKNQTTAEIDLSTVHVVNKDGVDVTNCYHFITEPKDITFAKYRIDFTFKNMSFVYDGKEHGQEEDDTYTYSREPIYGTHLEVRKGSTFTEISSTAYANAHEVKVLDDEGKDYTDNYIINGTTNYVTIKECGAIKLTSKSLEKYYDGEKFDESNFQVDQIEMEGELLDIHHLEVEFKNTDLYNTTENDEQIQYNSFTYRIVDDEGNDCSDKYLSVSANFGTISIKKRNIEFAADSITDATFDDKPKEKSTYTVAPSIPTEDAGLAPNEYEELISYTTGKKDPGKYDNELSFKIYKNEIIDEVETKVETTNNYIVTNKKGEINISLLPLKFNFKGRDINYDGQSHAYYHNPDIEGEEGDNLAVIDEEFATNLPENWKYRVSVNNSCYMTNYAENGYTANNNQVTYKIYYLDEESNEVDMTSYYQNSSGALSCTFETSSIKKIPLTLTVTDPVQTEEEKIFDNRTLGNRVTVDALDACVAATGLADTDELRVNDYESSTVKNTKDAQDDPYVIKFTYGVYNKTTNANVTSNYEDVVFDQEGKDYIETRINKRLITLKTKNVEKTYDAKTTFKPELEVKADSGELGTETVSIKNKTYNCVDTSDEEINTANQGTYTYAFDKDDAVVSVGGSDQTKNYVVAIEESGQLTVKKRKLEVSQAAKTSTQPANGVFYYDGKAHGVSEEVEPDNIQTLSEVVIQKPGTGTSADVGLLTGHTLKFDAAHSIKDVGSETYYASALEDEIKIFDDATGIEVTDNYDVAVKSDFEVEVVKKRVTLQFDKTTSPSMYNKIFDGTSFDLFPKLNYDQFYTESQMPLVKHTVRGYNNASTSLDTGHSVVIKKINKDLVNTMTDAGSYPITFEDFEWEIQDSKGNKVPDDYYEITATDTVNLVISKARVYVAYDQSEKIYDGTELPIPQAGEENAFNLGFVTGSFAYILNSSSVGPDFFNNFSVRATFNAASYENQFMYREGGYQYDASFKLIDSNGDTYVNNANAEIYIDGPEYYANRIVKRVVSLKQVIVNTPLAVWDVRMFVEGELAVDPDGLWADKLYFVDGINPDEEWSVSKTDYKITFKKENIRIRRGELDITNCYNIKITAQFII